MKVTYDRNDDLSFIENDKITLHYDIDILDFVSRNDISYTEKELLLRKFKNELVYLKFSIKKSPVLDKLFKDSDFETIEKDNTSFMNSIMSDCYVVYKDIEVKKFNTYVMYTNKCKYDEIRELNF